MGTTRMRTAAEFMDGQTMGLSAWSWDAWPAIKANIVRKASNQYGTTYTFEDHSRGHVAKGSARLRVTTSAEA